MRNLTREAVIDNVLNRNAGTSATSILTDIIDMQGFDGLALIALISSTAPASADLTVTLLHGDSSTAMVATDVNVTGNALAGDRKQLQIDIVGPLKRYMQGRLNPDGTDACPISSVVAIKYNAAFEAVKQSTVNVVATTFAVNPSST